MEFDFVIIGAGSAGCPVANRLSENGKYSVAVIEAGPKDTNPWIHIPVGYFRTMGNPKTDWCYRTEPDPGLNGRTIGYPRGRVLGGSSSINGLLYVRGQPQDFDTWAQMGNPGWSWDDVLPYFKDAETWRGDTKDADRVRGQAGPLSVSPSRLSRDCVDQWVTAAQSLGYPWTEDYNQNDQEGVGYFQLTLRGGRRCSSAAAFLTPIRHRKNLSILTNTQVSRLKIDAGRVTGIQAVQKGKEVTIKVRREVVLSAGAIGSPQILMLSGIGDAQALAEHQIPCRHNLVGVGKNLQDHLQARPVYKTTLKTINTEINSLFKQALIAARYAVTQAGPMTMAASLGTAFLKTEAHLETPDIQFHIQPFSASEPGEGTHAFDAFTASVLQLRPESKGEIRLRKGDPTGAPEIHPNYLATELDQRTIVKGIQVARNVAAQDPIRQSITEEFSPGREIAFDDFDGTLDWARNTAVTIYHPTSTCKMGPKSDRMAVVDARLRVHGIAGLRVADASIMPNITSGNTNAPSIMIGQKCGDMILEDIA